MSFLTLDSRPRTLPDMAGTDVIDDAQEITIVAVTVGRSHLPPHLSGRQVRARVCCCLPGESFHCKLRRATAHLPVGRRTPTAQATPPSALAECGQSCLFLGRPWCEATVKVQLLRVGSILGTVLGEAELSVSHGQRINRELCLLSSGGGEKAIGRVCVVVDVQSLSKGAVKQCMALARARDRGSAFVVDARTLLADEKPVQGVVEDSVEEVV